MALAEDQEAAHEETYSSFTSLLKWAVPTIAIIALIVIILIS